MKSCCVIVAIRLTKTEFKDLLIGVTKKAFSSCCGMPPAVASIINSNHEYLRIPLQLLPNTYERDDSLNLVSQRG